MIVELRRKRRRVVFMVKVAFIAKSNASLPPRVFGGLGLTFFRGLPHFPQALVWPYKVESEWASQLTTEQELRQKLRKIAALFEGATTAGERDAAAAASNRILAALGAAAKSERAIETQFTLPDRWARRLFTALCRRYGLEPYRYPRQRQTTVVLRAPDSFVQNTLWPEFLQIKSALDAYLNEATERIIREEVFRNAEEAAERVG